MKIDLRSGVDGKVGTLKGASERPFPYLIEISAIGHATESIKKVKRAILNVLPEKERGKISLSVQELRGHHGNPIFVAKANLKDPNLNKTLLERLAKELPEEEKGMLANEVGTYVDKNCNLYLRLDKQAAFT
ncbi:TPA: hypothetical protein EYP26_05265, partial [Candidatus Bathyarchaeota archaeon]|nr:hypothetical protein [Candidatus Bathyarchaeota archaeon]